MEKNFVIYPVIGESLSLRAKRGNLLFPQDTLHEASLCPGAEIATHLSGAHNAAFTNVGGVIADLRLYS